MFIYINNYKKQNTNMIVSLSTISTKKQEILKCLLWKLRELSTCKKSKNFYKVWKLSFCFHLYLSYNCCENLLQIFWKGIIQKGKSLKLHNKSFKDRRKLFSMPAPIEHRRNKPPLCVHAHTFNSMFIDSTKFY